jgi:hypothetical protein
MNRQFALFQSHLDFAHTYWKQIIAAGDTVIDATCGNGHDTLFLAQIVLTDTSGVVIACDLQKQALDNTEKRLRESNLLSGKLERVRFVQGCHSTFPKDLKSGEVKLIVYNLGYLPKGDKAKTTLTETTLDSLKAATELVVSEGIISVTCYPGHSEGKREEEAVLQWASGLDPRFWSSSHHQWVNREESPSLLLLQKGC